MSKPNALQTGPGKAHTATPNDIRPTITLLSARARLPDGILYARLAASKDQGGHPDANRRLMADHRRHENIPLEEKASAGKKLGYGDCWRNVDRITDGTPMSPGVR